MAVSDIITVRDLGLMPYEPVFAAMKAFTQTRTVDTPDEIWLLEHEPVFTLGQAADRSHLFDTRDIPVFQADRGGEVTYHAPGQAIVYLLVDLKRRAENRLLVREFVRQIEEAVIETLQAHQLRGERRAGEPGIYISADQPGSSWRGAKIGALGLKVLRNGCAYHGFSLNVAMDLQPFTWINPCGLAGLTSVDMKTMGVALTVKEAQHELVRALCRQLNAKADFSGSHSLPGMYKKMKRQGGRHVG
ncbi:lipoyl(octanoyl) transferase LipB [Oxalobacter sp. OttesenSCG-928-P03]|nr:lipoyl(octanoyl) transferase LipB [Oxalobacter sp. OttesenSCG-928-P03]